MGGEVTYMCHILRGGCDPLMVAPVLCLGILDGARMTGHPQRFQGHLLSGPGVTDCLGNPEGPGCSCTGGS